MGSREHYRYAASAAGRKGRGPLGKAGSLGGRKKAKKRKKKKEKNQIVFHFVCIVSFVAVSMSNNLLLKIASDLCSNCHLGNYVGKFLLVGIKRYCSLLMC